jgi:DNA-binding CsgD family transcriptional regulator
MLKDVRVAARSSIVRTDGQESRSANSGAELQTLARRWAVNEVGAAIVHQLAAPLSALLLYIHEAKHTIDSSSGGAANLRLQEMVDNALRETERVCAIMERIGDSFEGPRDSRTAIACGREAIRWLRRAGTETSSSGVDPPRFQRLTAREREVLGLIISGSSNKEGASKLQISPRTFEAHRAQIMRKLGTRNTAQLIRTALVSA